MRWISSIDRYDLTIGVAVVFFLVIIAVVSCLVQRGDRLGKLSLGGKLIHLAGLPGALYRGGRWCCLILFVQPGQQVLVQKGR